jgi:membrane associated rhomboid family serine protease
LKILLASYAFIHALLQTARWKYGAISDGGQKRSGYYTDVIPISDAPGPRRAFPLVNVALIAANIIVFVLFELGQPNERALEAFVTANGVVPAEVVSGRDLPPPAPLGMVYLTLFTSMFLHGGLLHLGGNMLYLWIFGDNVEDTLGRGRYLLFDLLCGILAGLAHIASDPSSRLPSIGASGAIAGVLAGYLLLFPHSSVRTLLFIGPFIAMPRISAVILIGFWFVMQVMSGLASIGVQAAQTSGTAWWAHIGGFVAGLVLVQLFRPSRDVVRAPYQLRG